MFCEHLGFPLLLPRLASWIVGRSSTEKEEVMDVTLRLLCSETVEVWEQPVI